MDSFNRAANVQLFYKPYNMQLFEWLPKIKSYELMKSTERYFLGIVRFQ